MNFEWDSQLKAWKCQHPLLGKTIEFTLIGIDSQPNLTKEAALSETVNRVESNIERILDETANSLLDIYNESWTDPENGFPELSKAEFTDQLALEAVVYEVEGDRNSPITLYYSESGIFGHHSVEVFWDSNDTISAGIIG